MRSWLLNAQLPAPISPRHVPRSDVADIMTGVGGTEGWMSTARGDYLGRRLSTPTRTFRPSPRANMLGYGGDTPGLTTWQTTHNTYHTHPGISPREIRKIRSNAPSEADHPMFGLQDPIRKMIPTEKDSSTASFFRAPPRSGYVYNASEAPYPDTAHTAFDFGNIGSGMSEQRSKYMWPQWTAPVRCLKPISLLGRLE